MRQQGLLAGGTSHPHVYCKWCVPLTAVHAKQLVQRIAGPAIYMELVERVHRQTARTSLDPRRSCEQARLRILESWYRLCDSATPPPDPKASYAVYSRWNDNSATISRDYSLDKKNGKSVESLRQSVISRSRTNFSELFNELQIRKDIGDYWQRNSRRVAN